MSNEAFVPSLPSLDALTEAERRWLGMRYHRLRNLFGMALGGFAETVVAELLPGSLEAAAGAARVDIEWTPPEASKPIGVEVKTSRGDRWDVSERGAREDGVRVVRRRADVYVLAHHEGDDHREGWTFFVVPRWRLDHWGGSSISTKRLRVWEVPELHGDELAAAVLAASRRPDDADHILKRDGDRSRLRRTTSPQPRSRNPGTDLAGRGSARPTARRRRGLTMSESSSSTMMRYSKDCLLTSLAASTLAMQMAQGGTHSHRFENTRMVGAERLWDQAQGAGLRLPVVFLDASRGGLVFWGVVDSIEVTDGWTDLQYRLIERLSPPQRNSSLVVKSTGQPLPDSYQRHYALCFRPAFIT